MNDARLNQVQQTTIEIKTLDNKNLRINQENKNLAITVKGLKDERKRLGEQNDGLSALLDSNILKLKNLERLVRNSQSINAKIDKTLYQAENDHQKLIIHLKNKNEDAKRAENTLRTLYNQIKQSKITYCNILGQSEKNKAEAWSQCCQSQQQDSQRQKLSATIAIVQANIRNKQNQLFIMIAQQKKLRNQHFIFLNQRFLIKYVKCLLQAGQLYSFNMTKIEHTNIIIDNFSIAKTQTNRTYTHILTHIHTDHLKGLHDGWTYGPIYCTESTKALLLYKFPNIPNIITLPLQTPTEIKMSETLSVTVTFFDANHCIGSVMVLIQGYMGRVLYTGDMRFDMEIFKKYSYLYPAEKQDQKFQRCSKQIDILYLDNTFLKNKFNFPPKHTVLKKAVDYIQQLLSLNKHKRVFIGIDSFGKQEVLVELATQFNMYIVVDQQRYELIRQTPLDIELFTTNKHEGIIEVVRKDKLYFNLKEVPDSIGIILSGWVNHPTYRFNQTIYCLPYSLHSNYEQIHQFVKSIRPSFIYPIVHQFPDQNRLFYAGKQDVSKRDLMFNQNLFQEEKGNYKLQIEELRFLFSSPPTEQYKVLSKNVQLQKKIDEQLRPPNFSNLFTSKKVTPLNMQVLERKKYNISNNRNQLEINRLKNQIKLKKKIIEGINIQDVEEVDAKPVELQDNSKSKAQVIAIDDQEQFQIMKSDVIEIDPLYQPINNTKNKALGGNDKSKSRSSFPIVHESGRLFQKKTVQNIGHKFKNEQQVQLSIQIFKTEKLLKDQSSGNTNNQIKEQILELDTDIKQSINKPIQCQPPKRCFQKSFKEIDMDAVRKVEVMNRKDDILMHLKKSPEQLQQVKKLFKKQKSSNK